MVIDTYFRSEGVLFLNRTRRTVVFIALEEVFFTINNIYIH
jgi:hypothetical protein